MLTTGIVYNITKYLYKTDHTDFCPGAMKSVVQPDCDITSLCIPCEWSFCDIVTYTVQQTGNF